MPEGYAAVPVRGRVVIMLEGQPGRPRPENPLGPAVLYVKGGEVRESFVGFEASAAPKP
jgi:hypothetical protein